MIAISCDLEYIKGSFPSILCDSNELISNLISTFFELYSILILLFIENSSSSLNDSVNPQNTTI